MDTKTTLAIALTAGFVGGIVSQRITPTPVHAQTRILKEIRAESFVLVDEKGAPRGAFGIDEKGFPTVEATDAKGRVLWIRWGSGWGKGKPSVVPQQ